VQLQPGGEFAGYRIVDTLGEGGMGQVFLVEHPHLLRREALKVISINGAGYPEFGLRFTNEARAAASLEHPAIVSIHNYGITDSTPWFTMSYLDGDDLTSARLTLVEAVETIGQVAAGLDYAHQRGVIHRDIKPANIVVTRSPSGRIDRAVLLDFGIAKLAEAPSITASNVYVGTMTYSAPEVLDGQPATALSDQYSLACTAYELLTGKPPFNGMTPAALIAAHIQKQPPPPSMYRPELAAVDLVFATALAKDPAHRFPTCTAFATTLAQGLLMSGPHPVTGQTSSRTTIPSSVYAAPTTPPPGAGPNRPPSGYPSTIAGPMAPRRRRRGRAILVGAIATAVISLVVTGVVLWPTPQPNETTAAESAALSQQISNSWNTTCIVNSGALYCMGNNGFGQVGDGTTLAQASLVKVDGVSHVTAVSTDFNTCAIADGEVYCWGNNEYGQLGDGTTTNRVTPIHVPGLSGATSVSTVAGLSCAVANATAYCWGNNKFGQVGDGTKIDRHTPTKISSLTNVSAIQTTGSATCAIADQTAYCWGSEYRSGNTVTDQSPDDDRSKPTAVAGLPQTKSISTAGSTTCAVSVDGKVYCWGDNTWGAVGNGTTDEQYTPLALPGIPTSTEVDTSGSTTCAATLDGLYCWGRNANGELGDGTSTDRLSPTRTRELTDVTAVTIGNYSDGPEHGSNTTTCAMANKIPYCWGAYLDRNYAFVHTVPQPIQLP
jgi:serine/threonine-protein kinase